jgi:tRNA A-37 threonylcarbamoyl transferase component Bud32
MIGRLVGDRYLIEAGIGEGGMSRVWRARDLRRDRWVALKQFREELGQSEELRQRLFREAEVLQQISHPGVVGVDGVLDLADGLWLIMEHVEGMTLKQRITEEPLADRAAAAIGLSILAALNAVHATGVLHRDVKPENILLTPDDRVVLVDFGIAAIEGRSGLTMNGQLIGTVDYTAPERLHGQPADVRSELWSLGVTLYRSVESRTPFRQLSSIATIDAILRMRPHAPERLAELRPVVDRLLDKNPETRITAPQLEQELRWVARSPRPDPVTGPSLTGLPEANPSEPKRRVRPQVRAAAPQDGIRAAVRAVRRALDQADLEAAAAVVFDLPPVQAVILLGDLEDAEAGAVMEQMCGEPARTAGILRVTTAAQAGRLLAHAHDRRSVAKVLQATDAARAGKILATMRDRTAAAVVEALAGLDGNSPSLLLRRPSREAAEILLFLSPSVISKILEAAPARWRAEVETIIRRRR